MKVLVCGGRDYTNQHRMNKVLDLIHSKIPITCIIDGDATGADQLAGYWARRNNVKRKYYPADWDTYKNAAGPIRNNKMLKESKPDLVLAFGGARGTNHMCRISEATGVRVERFD